MALAQLLLMNHFLAGVSLLAADTPLFANINDINSIEVDAGCPYGCVRCSAINGCLACKPPFYLLLRRDGPRQTASCTRACPKGFYKVTKKRNGFCAKCTMRGCAECDRHHYCSSCAADFVNVFGKCIPSHPDNSLETPYTRKTVYSPPAILDTSGTPPGARGTRPSHRTAGSSRTSSAPSAGPSRAPSAGPRRPPSSGPARTSSSAPPSSPPALVNYSRPSPALRVRPRRPEEKRPCRKKAAKKDKAGKDGGRRRDWKGRKKERPNKGKKGQKARRRGCRKRTKGRRNGPKTPQNATLPRGKSSAESPDGDSPPGETPEGDPSQGPPAATDPPPEAPSRHGEQPPRDEHLTERRQSPEDPPDGERQREPARAPMVKGLRTERIRPHGELAGATGKGRGKGGGSAQVARAGHRWQGLDADTGRRARARAASPGVTPKLPSRHKRRHKHDPRRRIPPATQAKTRLYVSSV